MFSECYGLQEKPRWLPFILLEQIILMQSSQVNKSDPFLIIYNHPNHPREHKRQHKDYSTLPHSIIMTRKMAAEQERKQFQIGERSQEAPQQESIESYSDQPFQDCKNFFEERALEKGIPIEKIDGNDLGFELNQPSPISNYSKLEKTLFELGIPVWDDGAQQIEM